VIRNIPSEARSLVLIVEDPDAPRGTWLHWLVWNIPVCEQIHENEIPGEQGMNDFGRIDYGGPCPPSGTHRYYFNVYALNALLELPEGCSEEKVRKAMEAHVIAHGELVGLYRKTS
jgi:Raf kinase inhibitor-like YbhB/YbcL family protein